MPAITPTVDACGSRDQSSVMCNQSDEIITLPVELQEIVEKITGVIDPAKLVKLKLSTPEKEYTLLRMDRQPDKSVLTCTSNKRQSHSRHCSPEVFLPRRRYQKTIGIIFTIKGCPFLSEMYSVQRRRLEKTKRMT